jgi:DNA polymerase III epsilon subunit family exonuclease
MVMENLEKDKIYCSLDIETSGFDPLKDEILEVGFLLFKVNGLKFEILEEWTQVFKPKGEVSSKILALTGITQKELDEAPDFSEFVSVIQKKIQDTVIVGHNVIFDIKFLESRGIKFSGQVIDTLDLVQWLLPTHHSYNLENLMHYFGISHKDAHRALADAKACLAVLEKLLKTFSGFSSDLKKAIIKLVENQNFLWPSLFLPFVSLKGGATVSFKVSKSVLKKTENLELKNHTAYNFGLGENYVEAVISNVLSGRKKTCLILPKQQEVFRLWKQGLVEPFFCQEEIFNEEKFNKFLAAELSADQAKFALKVLVWRATNWQAKILLDLNLTFFGGQFKSEISGGNNEFAKKTKLVCGDYSAFLQNKELLEKDFSRLIILGPAEFEAAISSNLSQKASWGGFSYLLKSVYNPETNLGNDFFAEKVKAGLDATDLFFGLAYGLLLKEGMQYADVSLTEDFKNSEAYGKIKAAAENYSAKVLEINKSLGLKTLEQRVENLNAFFQDQTNRVKWIELGPNRLVFNNSPLNIGSVVNSAVCNFKEQILVGSVGTEKIFQFFLKRLGLENFKIVNSKPGKKLKDLFTKHFKAQLMVRAENFKTEEILGVLKKDNLPAAVLFGSQMQVKDFFEANYKQLQEEAFLLNQSLSGGSNKLLRNFSIHKNSLLLATDKFILKSLSSTASNLVIDNLEAKALVITKLPFEQFTHPYAQAVAAQFENPFDEYSLPRAVYALHRILGFFYSAKLRSVLVFDSKLSKPYAKVFFEYFEQNKNLNIKN